MSGATSHVARHLAVKLGGAGTATLATVAAMGVMGVMGLLAGAAQANVPPSALTDDVTPAALADLGLAMLRQPGPPNAVVSPLATASALGMVHAGANGAAEQEIEALFGPHAASGTPGFRQRLPALLKQIGTQPGPVILAGRMWMDTAVAPAIPAGYTQRLTTRYGADAARLSFADAEAARGSINTWTAEHTAGRITELLPAGSVSAATQLVLTAAVHFRSAWEQPFDAALTAPAAFSSSSGSKDVPTMVADRNLLQASVDGTQVYALPFALSGPPSGASSGPQSAPFALLLGMPAEGTGVDALLKTLRGSDLMRWQGALAASRCTLSLPRFNVAPRAAALKPLLQSLGLKTVFTNSADLRPMLGRGARNVHLGDIHHAAGITIDERGGEAVAAAAATVQAKSLALPLPPCAVNRAFVFAVVHRATGTPLFVGRVGDPTLVD